ncbi:antichymotrypsin-2-like isoform X2 [Maniola jurtina]|uniref:antichymotrypsin-2-like isoform X2 n=1 Tax=Maniola jurtina TaxID=191418 RepID=UPI001E68DF64|nr:antichymotrypsin-2-like isoform X2 [Maniola jurtina]
MKPILIICFLSLAVIATGDQEKVEILLHDGNNKFTANMFSEVAKANPEQSFVISAFNVMTPLAQLGLASVGESHDELLNAIGMPDDDATMEVFSMVNTRIQSVKGVTLKTASKIYVAKNYELNSEFAALTRDIFGSEVQNLDFNQKGSAANEINAWVEEQTNNRIKDLVSPDSIKDESRAFLVNAIYFKGFWKAQFNKDLTRDMDFHVNNGETMTVSMMYRKGYYMYTESDDLKSQVIKIPYQGDETSLVVVLPRGIEGIKEVQEILRDPNVLDIALSEIYETIVELYLPTFRIDTTTDLKDILEKMNVTKVFDSEKAGLFNLIKPDIDKRDLLYIDTATQKAFIEVNEEGAEAAAVTSFGIGIIHPSIEPPPMPIEFKADHPFLFFLLEEGDVLFNGIFYS